MPTEETAAPVEAPAEVPVTAPAEPAPQEAPAEPQESVETPAQAETLYDLPDGRKVNGEELRRLYADELLPEFTRKSQELSTLQKAQQPQPAAPTEAQQEWVPQTWEEVEARAAERALQTIQDRERQAQEVRTQVSTAIDSTVAELKAADPNLNEAQLFSHATKYKFGDLKVAYQNMKDMNLIAKTAEQRTAQNIQQRQGQPIAGSTKAGGSVSDTGIDPYAIRTESPREMLRRIQNK